MNKKIVLTAGVLVIIAIILGAFGAHGLKDLVSLEKVASFETGVKYQMYGALSLLIVGFNEDRLKQAPKWFYRLLLSGIFCFSFSIYFLSIQEVLNVKLKFLGPITPLGGLLMILAWISILINLISSKK